MTPSVQAGLLAVLATIAIGAPLHAQTNPDLGAAATLRAPLDPRLSLFSASDVQPTDLRTKFDKSAVIDVTLLPRDSARGHYGLEGALIGGAATGLVGIWACGLSESCEGLGFVSSFGIGALPGLVVGGLVGALIRKPAAKPDSSDSPNPGLTARAGHPPARPSPPAPHR